MGAGWAALAVAMFLGKRKTQKIKSSTYYPCCGTGLLLVLVGLRKLKYWSLHLHGNGFGSTGVRYNYCCGNTGE
jgi:uncharacterized membrane protein